MAELDWILERERRQMELILELDMEELQVEEVDDAGSSSSSDVDTFLRNTHGDGRISTSEDLTVDTSIVSLQAHTYLGAKVDGGRGKFAFLDGDKVINLPMFYLQGVVLFPEASLPLRVIQPRLAEAIDKAVNHVDAPCMIGVVHAYRHANDGHHTIASVGTMAEIQEIRELDDGSSCVFSHGLQRFRLIRHWLDIDGVPWGEVRIIEEDTPQRTPRDAFGQLAASNNFRQCVSSMCSMYVSGSKQLDHVDSDVDGDSLSPTSTSSDHSVTDKRVYLSGSQSSGLVRCGSLDESSNEDEDPVHEQSCWCHDSVKEIDGCVQPHNKHTITGDEDDLCFASFQGVRKKDTKQQRHYHGVYNTKMASQASLSFWPRWAYEMYDPYSLARRAADLWKQVIVNPSMDDHVRKPNHLSFCIGSNLPISGSLRQELLEIDGISYRLQREIQLLKAFNIIRCRNCLLQPAVKGVSLLQHDNGDKMKFDPGCMQDTSCHIIKSAYMTTYLMSMKPPLRLALVAKTRWGVDFWNQHRNNTSIARRSDKVVVSSTNATGSHSFKEMITVHSATSLGLRGDPSKIYSWFPGYTWTIALCAACESNIGWLFRADKKNLHPKSFWAIRTSQISDDTQAGQV